MLEESFEQLDQKQCAAYLKKLKLPQEECTLEFLDRLIRRHLEEIPFENLDLVRTHELIQTDLDTVYKKIIQGRRGGYCFELNALFLGLLRGLGYQAYPVACRVLRRPGLRMPTHRASVVCADGKKYFCDVGYGGIACVRAALMEPGAVTHTDFGSFYFERECAGWLNFWHKGEKNREKSGIKIFMVAEFPSAPVDFAPANQAMCSPGAMFYDKVVVHRMTKYGPLSVEGNQVTLREKEGKKIVMLSSGEELREVLKKEFKIEVI